MGVSATLWITWYIKQKEYSYTTTLEGKRKSTGVFLKPKFKTDICNVCVYQKIFWVSNNVFISRCSFSLILKWSAVTKLKPEPSRLSVDSRRDIRSG